MTILAVVLAMVLLKVSLTGSVYIVLMVALERYLNICRPFRYTPQVDTSHSLPSLYKHIDKFLLIFATVIAETHERFVLQSILFAGEGYILFTVLFSVLFNLTKFMEFRTVYQVVTVNDTTK